MKTISRITSIVLASSIFVSAIPRTQANPAVLAPVSFCVGTAGVGCVLVGVSIVGGIGYYVWQQNTGKKVLADRNGQVLRYLDDPESDDIGIWEDPLDTRNEQKAEQICKSTANRMRAAYRLRRDSVTGKMICVFTGGTGI